MLHTRIVPTGATGRRPVAQLLCNTLVTLVSSPERRSFRCHGMEGRHRRRWLRRALRRPDARERAAAARRADHARQRRQLHALHAAAARRRGRDAGAAPRRRAAARGAAAHRPAPRRASPAPSPSATSCTSTRSRAIDEELELRPPDRRAGLGLAHAARSPASPSTRSASRRSPRRSRCATACSHASRSPRRSRTRSERAAYLTLRLRRRRLRRARGPRRAAGLRRRRDRPLPALPRPGHALDARRGRRARDEGDPADAGRVRRARAARPRASRSASARRSRRSRPSEVAPLDRRGRARAAPSPGRRASSPIPVVAAARPAADGHGPHRRRPLHAGRRPRRTCGRSATPPRCPTRRARASRARRPPSTALRQGRAVARNVAAAIGTRPPAAVPLPDARRVRRHGPPPGRGEHARDPLARLPGLVPGPHLPHGRDAGRSSAACAWSSTGPSTCSSRATPPSSGQLGHPPALDCRRREQRSPPSGRSPSSASGGTPGRRRAGAPGRGRILDMALTLADQVKTDVTAAMKAGDKERVGALRLVLSELQKAAKEGDGRRARRPAPRAQAPARVRRSSTATAGATSSPWPRRPRPS